MPLHTILVVFFTYTTMYFRIFPAFQEIYRVDPFYKVALFGWLSPGQIALQNAKLYTSALIPFQVTR